MNQSERRLFLIDALLRENTSSFSIPKDVQGQKDLLRSLFNVRPPSPIDERFLSIQDDYLKEELRQKGITRLSELSPVSDDLYLWQGDITTLCCDAIVNAANSGMTGCYYPLHTCIDNCIHTYAGVQLRALCHAMMKKQGHEEPSGKAKITPAFNLPCRYILHTVGPIVQGPLTKRHEALLASCYRSCLALAEENGLESLAFCCISTGVFGFPPKEAATIAIATVKEYKKQTGSAMKVIFNVFKDEDLLIYREKLN